MRPADYVEPEKAEAPFRTDENWVDDPGWLEDKTKMTPEERAQEAAYEKGQREREDAFAKKYANQKYIA